MDLCNLKNNIQDLNASLLSKDFSLMSFDQKIIWCKKKRELIDKTINYYRILKERQQYKDAVYFLKILITVDFFSVIYEIKKDNVLGLENSSVTTTSSETSSFDLALKYLFGIECQTNLNQAIEILTDLATQSASEPGHALAQYILGELYTNAIGTSKDYNKAFEYFKLASNQGCEQAQAKIGEFYGHGQIGETDIELALYYTNLAAHKGSINAIYALGYLYYRSNLVEHNYDKARYYFNLADALNVSDSQYYLALMYLYGHGVTKDATALFYYVNKVAGKGNNKALNIFGLLYAEGEFTKRDPQIAARYFRIAAEKKVKVGAAHLKTYIGMYYQLHDALLNSQFEQIKFLIEKKAELISELIWDLERGMDRQELFGNILNFIKYFKEKSSYEGFAKHPMLKVQLKYLSLVKNKFISKCLEGTTKGGCETINEKIDEIHFKNVLGIIEDIDISLMSQNETLEFLEMLMDLQDMQLWYVAVGNEAIEQTTYNCVKSILYRCKSLNMESIDTAISRRVLSMIVYHIYGKEFDVALSSTPATINVLLLMMLNHECEIPLSIDTLATFNISIITKQQKRSRLFSSEIDSLFNPKRLKRSEENSDNVTVRETENPDDVKQCNMFLYG